MRFVIFATDLLSSSLLYLSLKEFVDFKMINETLDCKTLGVLTVFKEAVMQHLLSR